jgi:hypothetical protein
VLSYHEQDTHRTKERQMKRKPKQKRKPFNSVTLYISEDQLGEHGRELVRRVIKAAGTKRHLGIFGQLYVKVIEPHALTLCVPTHEQGEALGKCVKRIKLDNVYPERK